MIPDFDDSIVTRLTARRLNIDDSVFDRHVIFKFRKFQIYSRIFILWFFIKLFFCIFQLWLAIKMKARFDGILIRRLSILPIPVLIRWLLICQSLKIKRVALLVNQTSLLNNTHLVDTLRKIKSILVKIFSPEHGFRGQADAGEHVSSSIDSATGFHWWPCMEINGSQVRMISKTWISWFWYTRYRSEILYLYRHTFFGAGILWRKS